MKSINLSFKTIVTLFLVLSFFGYGQKCKEWIRQMNACTTCEQIMALNKSTANYTKEIGNDCASYMMNGGSQELQNAVNRFGELANRLCGKETESEDTKTPTGGNNINVVTESHPQKKIETISYANKISSERNDDKNLVSSSKNEKDKIINELSNKDIANLNSKNILDEFEDNPKDNKSQDEFCKALVHYRDYELENDYMKNFDNVEKYKSVRDDLKNTLNDLQSRTDIGPGLGYSLYFIQSLSNVTVKLCEALAPPIGKSIGKIYDGLTFSAEIIFTDSYEKALESTLKKQADNTIEGVLGEVNPVYSIGKEIYEMSKNFQDTNEQWREIKLLGKNLNSQIKKLDNKIESITNSYKIIELKNTIDKYLRENCGEAKLQPLP